jgi:hypothetical protein
MNQADTLFHIQPYYHRKEGFKGLRGGGAITSPNNIFAIIATTVRNHRRISP